MYIVVIDEERCQACSECIDVCSQSMIALVEENGKKPMRGLFLLPNIAVQQSDLFL